MLASMTSFEQLNRKMACDIGTVLGREKNALKIRFAPVAS